jgi:hypothetical protein
VESNRFAVPKAVVATRTAAIPASATDRQTHPPPHDPRQVSAAPTLARPETVPAAEFDVSDLYAGPAAVAE